LYTISIRPRSFEVEIVSSTEFSPFSLTLALTALLEYSMKEENFSVTFAGLFSLKK